MVVTRIQINKPPPLDSKFEGVFVGGEEVVEEEVHFAETMTSEGKGPTDHENIEYIKLIQPLFDYITNKMNQQLMKGFKLLVSQFGSKLGLMGDSSSSHSEEKKTMGEKIFSRTGPHNRSHEFQSTPRPTAPKFIIPKEETNIQFEIDTTTQEWAKLDEECRRSITFE